VSREVQTIARRRLLALPGPDRRAPDPPGPGAAADSSGPGAAADSPGPGAAADLSDPADPAQPSDQAGGHGAAAPVQRRPWFGDRLPLVPATLRGGRLHLESRAAAAIVLVAVVAVLFGVGHWWRGRPQGVPVPDRATVVASPTAAAGGGVVVVDVQGRVRRPGIVRLRAGSRAVDAVRAAGGVVRGASTSGLNLARVLSDGEQLVVGATLDAPPNAGSPSAQAGSPLVDLNAATLEQLDALPGVGPVLAQRIIDFRQEHGRFSSVEELQEVPGIGPAKFATVKTKVRV
jgi:competence protein ComEA